MLLNITNFSLDKYFQMSLVEKRDIVVIRVPQE